MIAERGSFCPADFLLYGENVPKEKGLPHKGELTALGSCPVEERTRDGGISKAEVCKISSTRLYDYRIILCLEDKFKLYLLLMMFNL